MLWHGKSSARPSVEGFGSPSPPNPSIVRPKPLRAAPCRAPLSAPPRDPNVSPLATRGTILCMSGGAWMLVWMMLALKIPIAALLYICWWSVRQTPETAEDDSRGGERPASPSSVATPQPAAATPGPSRRPAAGAARAHPREGQAPLAVARLISPVPSRPWDSSRPSRRSRVSTTSSSPARSRSCGRSPSPCSASRVRTFPARPCPRSWCVSVVLFLAGIIGAAVGAKFKAGERSGPPESTPVSGQNNG